jgi:hypothetical protein
MQVKICRAKEVTSGFYVSIPNCSSINIVNNAIFEVPTEVLLNIQVFWNVTVCCWASSSRHFKGPSGPDDEGTTIL